MPGVEVRIRLQSGQLTVTMIAVLSTSERTLCPSLMTALSPRVAVLRDNATVTRPGHAPVSRASPKGYWSLLCMQYVKQPHSAWRASGGGEFADSRSPCRISSIVIILLLVLIHQPSLIRSRARCLGSLFSVRLTAVCPCVLADYAFRLSGFSESSC